MRVHRPTLVLNFSHHNSCFLIHKQEGFTPFMLVGTLATADLGAIDPLNEMSDLAHEYNIWFHVDAALGGFLMLCDEFKQANSGKYIVPQ